MGTCLGPVSVLESHVSPVLAGGSAAGLCAQEGTVWAAAACTQMAEEGENLGAPHPVLSIFTKCLLGDEL